MKGQLIADTENVKGKKKQTQKLSDKDLAVSLPFALQKTLCSLEYSVIHLLGCLSARSVIKTEGYVVGFVDRPCLCLLVESLLGKYKCIEYLAAVSSWVCRTVPGGVTRKDF